VQGEVSAANQDEPAAATGAAKKMAEKKHIVDDANRLFKAGASIEMILIFLRENGLLQLDSIIAIRKIMGNSLQEAKEIIDASKTWSDQYRRSQHFRETAWRALEELSRENDVTLPKISIREDS
jgi:ribosomal protein L7/L12